jgi:hypothetical protein
MPSGSATASWLMSAVPTVNALTSRTGGAARRLNRNVGKSLVLPHPPLEAPVPGTGSVGNLAAERCVDPAGIADNGDGFADVED